MIQVVVAGAAGRLGRKIVEKVLGSNDLELAGGLVRPGSKADGQDLGALVGLPPIGKAATSDETRAITKGSVVVIVAPRQAALTIVERGSEQACPLLVATTGFSETEQKRIDAAGGKVPLLVAPNLSLGIAVLTDLVRRASESLPGYDLEVLEIHHRKKRDAPSGTAWSLARAADEARGRAVEDDAILARAGETGPRGRHELGIQALRGGDVIGEHTVYVIGASERLELTHRAQSRDVFAEGALTAARFLGAKDRPAGCYSMADVLGLV
jgi:4-hydroxy-tetrahydrodipicolinate reductase